MFDATLVPVRRALISVSDKTGLVDFAHGLDALGVALAVGCAVSLHPASPTSPSVVIAATIVSRTAMPRAVDAIRFPLFIAVNSHPPRRTRPPGRARPAR
jgi:hypothetical protein